MRDRLVCFAVPLAFAGAIAGCLVTNNNPSGSSGSGSGGSGSGSNGSGAGTTTSTSTSSDTSTSSSTGGGAKGWTLVPLLDDTSDPANKVFRSDNDLVTGIYFSSIDDGWVTTKGSQGSFGDGGAIYKAKQKQLTSLLFSGNRNGLCLVGSIDFGGIDKSPDGFVALGYACDVIASHDGGKTFGIEPALAGQEFGIERVLAMRSRASDTLMVADTGYLAATAQGAPGPKATWTTLWAPEANPPTPNPVPANECQAGPRGGTPTQRGKVFVSGDGKLIAYVTSPNFDPQVCLSTDGGKTFLPKVLPGVPSDAQDFSPNGVTFANATTGIAFWANNIYPGISYVYRTTDAGQTWASVALPSDVTSKAVEFASAFFAPDGNHGWIVGYDYDASAPLLLRTDDGGATWKRSGGDLASKLAKGNGGKLFTGFALDADHIWVGGDWGVLAANDSGGE